MAEQEYDKSEEPTPSKLREARKRGQVAKSTDVNAVSILFAGFVCIELFGDWMLRYSASIGHHLLLSAGAIDFEVARLLAWLAELSARTFFLISPLLVAALFAGILANIFQTGPILSFQPIKPDFKRINPAEGFKRLFSKRTLFDAGKTLLKVVAFSGIAYALLANLMPLLLSLFDVPAVRYPAFLLEVVTDLLGKLLIAAAAIAVLDLVFARRDFLGRMRMSRREVKEEVKRQEGDPLVRAKIQQLQRELRQKARGVGRVKDADVVIINPTHFAVALKYDRRDMDAPEVLARGAGKIAARMIAVAKRYRVPVIQHRSLAQLLYWKGAEDAPIPEAAYERVAHIMAWLLGMRPDLREGTVRAW
ncbi:MAG TPA: EscU/YscU/HrcU family type III secretion system export apparatus switch protein [Gammaproteobacteria bacterium]|nr:EscU/YscU/HrcU family type III secretion system export apparatus switch protein [Gammaproteobacteria bacterium]